MRSHYNISSSIRAKLGLESNSTNLGIYLRKLLTDGVTTRKGDIEISDGYTPQQLRGALLCELFFDYLGWLIVACAFLNENSVLEVAVIVATIAFIVLGVRALIVHRSDIHPLIKLMSSMSQFSVLSLLGTISVALLFAEAVIPQSFFPYIGYPAFLVSQFVLIYGIYRYVR